MVDQARRHASRGDLPPVPEETQDLSAKSDGDHGKPVIVQPTKGWHLRLRELVTYRELFYFFVWRDLKVRYKQTFLGAMWALLQPFLLMVVFSIFLGKLASVSSEGLPYPIFAFAALVPWTLFASSLNAASTSLVSNANLVSRVYFPRIILPLAAGGSFLVDFVIALALLAGMMAFYGIHPTAAIAWFPALTVLALLAALSVGLFFAAINAKYRDVQYAVPFLVQVWLFLSPVAYSASIVPRAWRTVFGLNPMAGVVEGFRWALLGTPAPPLGLMLASSLMTLVLLVAGVAYFQRVERWFADVI